jgi:hypothetical protein
MHRILLPTGCLAATSVSLPPSRHQTTIPAQQNVNNPSGVYVATGPDPNVVSPAVSKSWSIRNSCQSCYDSRIEHVIITVTRYWSIGPSPPPRDNGAELGPQLQEYRQWVRSGEHRRRVKCAERRGLLSGRLAEPLGAGSVSCRDADLCICQDARQFAIGPTCSETWADIAARG